MKNLYTFSNLKWVPTFLIFLFSFQVAFGQTVVENYDDDPGYSITSKDFTNDGIRYQINGTSPSYSHVTSNGTFSLSEGGGSDYAFQFDTNSEGGISSITISLSSGGSFNLNSLSFDILADANITFSSSAGGGVIIPPNDGPYAVYQNYNFSSQSGFSNITSFTISGGNIVVDLDDLSYTIPSANTPPTASSFTAANGPYENLTYTFSTANFGYLDSDGNPLSHVLIESIPAAGTLYVDVNGNDAYNAGEEVSVNSQVSKANLDAGNLQYIQNGSTNTSFQFEVNDGTVNSSGNYIATLNVNPVPTVTLSLTPTSKSESLLTNSLIRTTLSNVYGAPVTVNLGLSGTATGSGVDYSVSGTSITINPGNTTGTVILSNVPDALYEGNETVIIDITSVTNGVESGTQQQTFTIIDDDPVPTVSLEVLGIYNPITDESGGQAYVRAKLDSRAGTTVTVPLTFSGTASGGGTDYSITGSTITLSPGETMDSIRVTSQYDGIEEGDETIIIDMGTPTNATTGTPSQVTITIIDEDATPPTGYSVSIDQIAINSSNETAASFTFAGAELGATYNYEFTSSGGGTAVSGSGTIATASDQITGIDLSGVGDGLITLSATLEDGLGNVGSPATDTKNKDTVAPAGYDVDIDQDPITPDNDDAVSFTFSGTEVGTTYEYTFTSSGGGTPVTNTGTIITATDQITGIDLSGLALGTITLSVSLTDASNNEGLPAEDEVLKRTNIAPVAAAPTISGVQEDVPYDIPDNIQVADSDADILTLTFTITGGTVTLGTSGITFGGSMNGSANFTASGSIIDLNAALDAATFVSDLNLNGTGAGTISFVANDGAADSNTASVTFDIEAINDDPTLSGLPASLSMQEDGSLEVTYPFLIANITDADVPPGTADRTIIFEASSGHFEATNIPASISISGDGTSRFTLEGKPDLIFLAVNAGTLLVHYIPEENLNGVGATQISLYANDNGDVGIGGGTDVLLGTVSIDIEAVNDAPTFTGLPTDISVQEGIASNIDLSAATFGDVDSGSGNVTLSFLFSGGTLSASSTTDVVVNFPIPGAMNLVGTAAAIEAFLNTPSNIKYTNAPGTTGDNAATLSVSANDNGNTGTGGGLPVNFGMINIDVVTLPVPSVTISSVPIAQSESVTDPASITATLSNAYSSDVIVSLSFSGTATGSGVDYSISATSITISAGNTSNSIYLTNVPDALYEGNETVIVDISSVSNGTENGIQQVTYTIEDDDPLPKILSIGVFHATEGGDLVGTVTFDKVLAVLYSLPYSIGGGTASPSDYGTPTFDNGVTQDGSNLLIPAGINSFSITLPTIDDNFKEPTELVPFTFNSLTINGNIYDNDVDPGLSINNVNVNEEAGIATFTVTLSTASTQVVSVDYSTGNGSAIVGSDFTSSNGTLNFAIGETTKNIIVNITDDLVFEGNEDFSVSLSNSINAIISTSVGTGTIIDNESDPLISSISSPSAVEGADLIYSVSLSNSSATSTTFSYSLVGGTALASDYGTVAFSDGVILVSGNLVVPAFVTSFNVTLPTIDDLITESDETVLLSIGGVSNSGSIINDDQASVTIADVSGNEDDGAITLTATLDNAVDGGFSVDVSTADGTATVADNDYSAVVSQTLTFVGIAGETETITVTPILDGTPESNETLTVSMSNLVPLAVSSGDIDITDIVTVTILNDDVNAPSNPDLAPSSDSGISDTDNITNDLTPTFTGVAETGSLVTLTSSLDGTLGTTTADGSGNWSITPSSNVSSGIHQITATASDLGGNTSPSSGALSVTFDVLAPNIVLIVGLNISLDINGDSPTLSASDLVASPPSDDYSSSGNIQLGLDKTDFNCSDVGTNTVVVTATDEAGNAKTENTIVFVQDFIAPTILAKSAITLNVDSFGTVNLTPAMVDEGSTDACGILSQTFSQSVFDRTDEGVNNVIYTVTDVNGNPSQTSVAVTVVVVPKVLNITVDAGQSKVYGDTDPVYTFTALGFEAGDDETILTGALARTAGENAGNYPISLGTLDAGANYTINFAPADFEITPATLNITANAGQSKVYGEADPAFSYTSAGFKGTDSEAILTGTLSRAAGENMGMYAINQGTLSAGGNYMINFTGANFAIIPAILNITANAGQSKVYGEADPSFTYSVAGLKNGDTEAIVSGSLIRIAGEDVGIYAIQPGTIDAGSNYTINYTSADFAITQANLNVTANPGQTKIYGNADPNLTYQATGFKNGDGLSVFTGSLARATGENIGSYAINIGTLSAGINYTINFIGADFTITPRTLNIVANPNQAKVYGSADPVLTFTASNFGNGDNNTILTGALSREFGEKKGKYAILIGSLSAGSNYTINFTSATFTIAAKVLDVTADAGQGKVFGTADPVLTYQVSGLENGDDASILSGVLARAPGENVGTYAITLGTLDAGFNYAINYAGADFTVSKAEITGITFPDGNFVYDGTAKSLAITGTLPTGVSVSYANNSRTDVGTQEVTATISGSNYNQLVLKADLTITPGSITGITFEDESFVYDGTAKSLEITGTLPAGASVSYTNNSRTDVGSQEVTATISGSNFTSFNLTADLSITPATLDIVADPDQNKLFGESDPELTYYASGFGAGDDVSILTGSLERASGESVGMYSILLGTLDAGSNYTIDFTGADFEIISNDSDGDGVPDDVENQNGTDPVDPMDYQDEDGDDVPDYVEGVQGTDPADAGDYLDTDGDDVPDYVEEQQGTDPNDETDFLDEDEDGIPDYVQARSVTEFVTQSLEVLWGTESGDLKVPTDVVVITSKGEFINLPVTWDLTGYDPLMSGVTNYMGKVELPEGLFNPDELQPMLEITVLAKPAPQDVTLGANSFIGIPDQYFQEIGAFTVIDPTDNVHMFSLPEGVQDNDFFEVLDGILFWSSAEQAGGRTEFTILLQVTDRAGNVLEKSFQITRQRTPLNQLDVPNTFTPNGDGVNDTWGVLALRYYTGVRISILSVGGDRVFYTENPDVQWDGIFNGKEMPVGAYLYVIEVGETGEIRRGMLNLLRQ